MQLVKVGNVFDRAKAPTWAQPRPSHWTTMLLWESREQRRLGGLNQGLRTDDDAPLGKPTATTCCGCSYDGTTAATAMMVRPLLSRSAHNFCHLQQMSDAVAAASDGGRHAIIRRRLLTAVTWRYHTTATIRRRRRRRAVDAASDGPQAPLLDHRRCPCG